MRANRIEYLFSVNTHTPPTMTVDSGEEFTVEVRGAFDDVEDISAVPTPFTPACDGHPLAPIAGPIVVRGAKPGDVVAIDVIGVTSFGVGKSAASQSLIPNSRNKSNARLTRAVSALAPLRRNSSCCQSATSSRVLSQSIVAASSSGSQ